MSRFFPEQRTRYEMDFSPLSIPSLTGMDDDEYFSEDDDWNNYVEPGFESESNDSVSVDEDITVDSLLREYEQSVLYELDEHPLAKEQFILWSLNAYRILAGDVRYRKKILFAVLENNIQVKQNVYFPTGAFTAVTTSDTHFWTENIFPRIRDNILKGNGKSMELIEETIVPDFAISEVMKPQAINMLLKTEWFHLFTEYLHKLIFIPPRGQKNKNFIFTLVSSPAKIGSVTHYMAVIIDKSANTIFVFDPSKGIWGVGSMVMFAVQEYAKNIGWSGVAIVPKKKWQLSCNDIWCQTWSLYFQYQVLVQFFIENMSGKDFTIMVLNTANFPIPNRRLKENFISFINESLQNHTIRKDLKLEYKQSVLGSDYENELKNYNELRKELQQFVNLPDNTAGKLHDIREILGELEPFEINVKKLTMLSKLNPVDGINAARYNNFFPNDYAFGKAKRPKRSRRFSKRR